MSQRVRISVWVVPPTVGTNPREIVANEAGQTFDSRTYEAVDVNGALYRFPLERVEQIAEITESD